MAWRRSSRWRSGPSLSWFSTSICRTCTASTCSSSFETMRVRERSRSSCSRRGATSRAVMRRCPPARRIYLTKPFAPQTLLSTVEDLLRGVCEVTQTGSPHDDAAFPDFLDDYFAECEEHLTGVRRLLLALETSVGRADINRPVLDELFRHFHSLKGISGMVELRQAEDLAHRLEEFLRALRQGDVLTHRGHGRAVRRHPTARAGGGCPSIRRDISASAAMSPIGSLALSTRERAAARRLGLPETRCRHRE